MADKEPLWKRMVQEGLVVSRSDAESWVMMGRVLVNDQRIEKSGHPVPTDADIEVKGIDKRYVSRGGKKLEAALSRFSLDVEDRVAIDCGASTGGFTDCLLQHGAKKVYAVDVGYGQLAGSLRVDPRVVNMERTNIGEVERKNLSPLPKLATVDLSYLSLKQAVPIIADLLAPKSRLVLLVKPLFEVEDPELPRRGRVENPETFETVLRDLADFFEDKTLMVRDLIFSPVIGGGGTREFFILLAGDPESGGTAAVGSKITAAVAEAVQR